MNRLWYFVACAILAFGISACDRAEDGFRTLHEAEANVLAVYTGADPIEAREALIRYRNMVIESSGFSGLLSVPKTLVPTDARLFAISRHIGDNSGAEKWFQSYKSNLNIVRQSESKPPLSPDENSVAVLVDRLDAASVPKWRTGKTRH